MATMEWDKAEEILLGSGGQVVRIGSPLAQAIECAVKWVDRLGGLYDAREAEVLELLRERNRITKAVERVRALHPEGDTPFCAYCSEPYPCTTVLMLDAPAELS